MARFSKAVAAALAFAGSAWMVIPARACDATPGTSSVAAETRKDTVGRAVALVRINGQGPFRFILDTGANRSVIAQSLATRLKLAYTGVDLVHSVDGAELASLVDVDSLSFGTLRLSGGATPVLDGPMLDGEQGLLGVDGMAGRVLHVDFTRNCVQIHEDAAQMSTRGWLSVPASVRFGTMLMVRGEIMGVGVNVLIDTGSDISLANERFREALRDVGAHTIEYHNGHAFTFGRPIVLTQRVWTPRLHLGRTVVDNVNAFIGNYHIFDVWGLQDEPTVLIGMDVLARSREMAIDYESGVVHFRKRPRGDFRGGSQRSSEGDAVAGAGPGSGAVEHQPPARDSARE